MLKNEMANCRVVPLQINFLEVGCIPSKNKWI